MEESILTFTRKNGFDKKYPFHSQKLKYLLNIGYLVYFTKRSIICRIVVQYNVWVGIE